MNLEDLMNIEVTSVAKKEQRLSRTAAAVFVITQNDIRHSSATNIPDLLLAAWFGGYVIVHDYCCEFPPPDVRLSARRASFVGHLLSPMLRPSTDEALLDWPKHIHRVHGLFVMLSIDTNDDALLVRLVSVAVSVTPISGEEFLGLIRLSGSQWYARRSGIVTH